MKVDRRTPSVPRPYEWAWVPLVVCLLVPRVAVAQDLTGALVGTVKALKSEGAARVAACFSHAVLSGPAMERIEASELEQVVVTDTVAIPESKMQHPKITVLSVASLLGEAIARIHSNSSVSSLFV